MMPGHVFIVRGDLRRLACDAWLMPCSGRAVPEDFWFLPDNAGPRSGTPFVDGGPRVQRLPGEFNERPQPWLCRIGRSNQPISWYVDGAIEFLEATAESFNDRVPLFGRAKHLAALPLVGTGKGGVAHRAGEVVSELLPRLRRFVAEREIDVALVCWRAPDYAAAQAERERLGIWADALPPKLQEAAKRLTQRALKGELALFIGAGVSRSAGLPDWKELLQALAKQANMTESECSALARVHPLDQATIIQHRLEDVKLGDAIATQINKGKFYSLTHALLAALPVREVVTTNYDQLFELAWEQFGAADLSILPSNRTVRETRRWLLKMHGCVTDPDRIVLSRTSYTRYDENLPALAGMLQAFLITRHMLFVGFSLTDDNFHRIVDAVRRLINVGRKNKDLIGTTISLGRGGLAESIWQGELDRVPMIDQEEGDQFPYPEAARRQQIFLDCLLSQTRDLSHLLVGQRFDTVLTSGEKRLREALQHLIKDLSADSLGEIRETVTWHRIQELLVNLGCQIK